MEENKTILDEANSLKKDFELFSKKSIMLFEVLRLHMGEVPKNKKDKSDHDFLDTSVLNFFKQETIKWSRHFAVYDKETKLPMTRTTFDLNTDEFKPFAYLDEAACRIIYGQIAQQSKLRSLFVKYGKTEITLQIPKVTKNSKQNGDNWTARPVWWNGNEDDLHLLIQVLDIGYTNFNTKKHDFCRKRMEEVKSNISFDSASIQTRVIFLTRELAALDHTTEINRKRAERERLKEATPEEEKLNKKLKIQSNSIRQTCIIEFVKGSSKNTPVKKKNVACRLCKVVSNEILPELCKCISAHRTATR